ncbi:hypothetical protein L1987_60957 [Smallanthus sonchifolius]|uniref:Uncharacterized protein n=1 Tax=Smallanthus sonchifolius TaxID=185202 RepID=A0ACB9D9Q2_9ASTR|nr:hypothetical protein L1987_60957 [Smallanthus sonchifolius]
MQTSNKGTSGPSSSTVCNDIPESHGAPIKIEMNHHCTPKAMSAPDASDSESPSLIVIGGIGNFMGNQYCYDLLEDYIITKVNEFNVVSFAVKFVSLITDNAAVVLWLQTASSFVNFALNAYLLILTTKGYEDGSSKPLSKAAIH